MNLIAMKKPDLVKLASEQRKIIKELKALLEGGSDVENKNMNILAQTYFQSFDTDDIGNAVNKKYVIDKLMYDPITKQSKFLERKEYTTQELALHHFDMSTAELIMRQKFKKESK